MTRARNSANLASHGNLFVDITNDRTGIGSVVPAQNLHVAGTAGFHADVTFTGDLYNTNWDRSDNSLKFVDNAKVKFGTGNDLQIYHDGSHSYIADLGTGNLSISSSAGEIQLANSDFAGNFEHMVRCVVNNQVELYYNGSKKFETTAYGTNTTGTAVNDGLVVAGVATVTTMNVTGVLTYDDVTSVDSIGIITARSHIDVGGHITLPDQASGVGKIKLGDGVDFQLYHNGTDSFIENRTGNLNFYVNTNELAAKFVPNGTVELYHNNLKKFETKAYGIDVTGTTGTDGLAVSGVSTFSNNLKIDDRIKHIGDENTQIRFPAADTFTVETSGSEALRVDSNGHVRFGSSGSASSSDWGHSTYGNTEVAIDGGGGYGVLHFRGDGAGSTATQFSIGAGDDKFYMAYDNVDNRHNIVVTGAGNVGINKNNPTTTLEVDGTVTVSTNLNFRDLSSSAAQASPASINLGGTYSNAAGNGTNLNAKLKLWSQGAEMMGMSVSANQLDFILTQEAYDFVWYAGNSGTTEMMRLEGTGNVQIPNDSVFLQIGASQDLDLHHNGTNSYIRNKTGNLHIRPLVNEEGIILKPNGAVELYHNNVKKIETSSDGATFSGSVLFPDNQRIKIGGDASTPDLQIYHDGSNTRVIEGGTGDLYIDSSATILRNAAGSENIAKFIQDGAVELYHNNSKKLETSSSGATVTGTLTATSFTGNLTGNVTGAATRVTVTDQSSDTSCNVLFTQAATGNLTPHSGSNLTFNSSTGALTATSFVGDGSNLTGITQTTISGNADNRVITGSGTANTLNAESKLTFDGTNLRVDQGNSSDGILGQAYSGYFGLRHADQTANAEYMILSNDSHTYISASAGSHVYIRSGNNDSTNQLIVATGNNGLSWRGNTVWHAGNDGSGSGLDADTLDGQQGSYYTNASNLSSGTIPAAVFGGGSARESGISPVGNFGQWQTHATYTNFNTEPAYWGWNYVMGNSNAPNTASGQWYRCRLSLGSEYGKGSSSGDYSMEMTIPRTQNGAQGQMWVRPIENGVESSWMEVGSRPYNSVIPRANNTIDLGDSNTRWRNLYSQDLNVIKASGNLSGTFVASNGLGTLEIGGSTGAFIDLKQPSSDDFDMRMGTAGSGGYVTVPSGQSVTFNTYVRQSALIHFDVKLTSGTSSGDIKFNTVLENVGSHYSTSTGRFTAPIAGVYHFAGTVLQTNSGGQFDVNLRYNGGSQNKGNSMRATFTGHSTIQISETLKMNANDYVHINVSSGSLHHDSGGAWCGFQGTLLG